MTEHDLQQEPAVRRFQALLDSLDHPHDPEYHWLRNERRHPGQPLQALAGTDDSPPKYRRRLSDRRDNETD